MKQKNKNRSLDVANALARSVVIDLGRKIVRLNRERAGLKRLERRRIERVLELRNLGGFKDESRDND